MIRPCAHRKRSRYDPGLRSAPRRRAGAGPRRRTAGVASSPRRAALATLHAWAVRGVLWYSSAIWSPWSMQQLFFCLLPGLLVSYMTLARSRPAAPLRSYRCTNLVCSSVWEVFSQVASCCTSSCAQHLVLRISPQAYPPACRFDCSDCSRTRQSLTAATAVEPVRAQPCIARSHSSP